MTVNERSGRYNVVGIENGEGTTNQEVEATSRVGKGRK